MAKMKLERGGVTVTDDQEELVARLEIDGEELVLYFKGGRPAVEEALMLFGGQSSVWKVRVPLPPQSGAEGRR